MNTTDPCVLVYRKGNCVLEHVWPGLAPRLEERVKLNGVIYVVEDVMHHQHETTTQIRVMLHPYRKERP